MTSSAKIFKFFILPPGDQWGDFFESRLVSKWSASYKLQNDVHHDHFLYSIEEVVILTTKSFIGPKYGFLWKYLTSYTYLESVFRVLPNEILHLLEKKYFTEKVTWRIGRIPYPSQSRDLSIDNQFKTWFVHFSFLYWSVWAKRGDFCIIWSRKIM